MPSPCRRTDWKAVREGIDLAAVATNLLGPAPGRRGGRGRRLWWRCPLGSHEDGNPSFCIDPGKGTWKCFGCGESGDAVALLRRLNPALTFPEAVRQLTGGTGPAVASKPRKSPQERPASKPPAESSGLPALAALALVEAAAARLWTPEGADALAYLTGPRHLASETIRAARLGCTPGMMIPRADATAFRAFGVVVPWFASGSLTRVNVRQPDGRRPKYLEAFCNRVRHTGIYPGPDTIRPGRALVIVEGEFDALALGEALGELAAVVTLGSASARPGPGILAKMLAAAPWFIATDNDPAGDKAAAGWPARARRVPPPERYKDWTEAKADGVNLRRWWTERLGGNEAPPLFVWDELASWRWGPAANAPRGESSTIGKEHQEPTTLTSPDNWVKTQLRAGREMER